eukprot:12426409-Ditylum_brightwellii.AAC.2
MSIIEQTEMKRAIEEPSGPHIYANWNTVQYLLLRNIKNNLSVLGTSTAIFARDEYQEDSANVCYNHLIMAIDKSTMNRESK